MKDQLIGKALLGILAGAMASAIKEVEQEAEQATDTNGHDQHGGLPKEVLELLSEKLGVPISDIHVVNGGELNPSDIFGPDDEDEETHCPSYAGGEAKDHLLMQLKEHEAEAQRIRDLLNS